MNSEKEDWAGGAWLAATYGIEPVMPLAVVSRIGGRRATLSADGITTETYVQSMRPASSLRGHLTFHLKHELPHLELLSRLFSRINPQELVAWAADEPSGQYARRAGFLYEFLTARQLPMRTEMAGAYVDAIDAQKLVAASRAQAMPDRRWRVRDNMPGTRDFCPVIRQTAQALTMMALDVPGLIHQLALEFGDELLMRSAVWMTLRESKASFALEGEADQQTRIGRFADALARRCGQGAPPLDHATLAELQSDILGQRTTLQQFGLRQSPVFVGEVVRLQELVHYIAPPATDIAAMLDGVRTFLQRTQGQSPVLRSAVAAFGFVYIHPLADGNGRVHRFLMNDILRRDGAVQEPMILPVSSLITSDQAERRAYDLILDELSRPLMRSVADLYAFAPTTHVYPDGISSNFVFQGDDSARHVWRYPDLTKHVVYLARVLERTIREDMREESRYLRSHTQARAAIKDIIEMPDLQIDRVIRSAQVNQGQLSGLLAKEIPLLEAPGVWAAIRQTIENAFRSQ
ncbi:MAG: cell filamentation protein Fic [Comamonadaceae bacterium CG12_big_fil_rev_8_21_14_0_65_59_15]|nr:MAG: cell filamentation protein Fic [Comamonadaceae bacterium CG12_big_fil_rev_8_21_14_0_65_59_15]